MSQTKAQLVAPVGVVTATAMNVSGVLTATTFDGSFTGAASSIAQGNNLNVGVVTASGIAGDITGSATSITQGTNVTFGSLTASRLVGNLTGDAVGNALGDALSATVSGITTSNNISAGVVTSTDFRGDGTNISGVPSSPVTAQTIGTTYSIDVTASGSSNYTLSGTDRNGAVSGSDPTVTVEVGDTLNFVVDASGHPFYIRVSDGGANVSTPAATNQGSQSGTVSWTPNTAGTYYYQCGNHAGMIGTITVSATTTIDLSNGNLIYYTQTANTTVSFANSENGNVYFVRTDDNSGTDRTITWPTGIGWSGGSAPTLINNVRTSDAQVFLLVTRNMGETWYGKEVMRTDPQTYEMWLSGRNYYGEFGINVGEGPASLRSSPVQMGANNWARSMVAHNGATTWGGVKTDGTAWFAGLNNQGQYNQDKIYHSSPVQMGTDTNWAYINNGPSQSVLASKTDGTLWAWSANTWGNLGQNDRTGYSSPMQIPGSWSGDRGKIKVGQLESCAIKADGTLWSWGYNKQGVLGLNTACPGSDCYFSSPTQVGTDTSWQHVLGGHNTVNAIKTDGTLWVWGKNDNGQLGLNAPNPSSKSSPTQIPGTTWAWASGAEDNMMATKTDGTMWVWGSGGFGALGLNDTVKRSSPTQIPGTTWALKEFSSIGNGGMTALKTDGTAWSWGRNQAGELGTNDLISQSSPVQIPGTSWGRIDGNPYLALCILKKA